MAMTVNESIERIRAAVDLVAIAGRYGVKLRRSGTQLSGLCPFHKERTPSFYIHPTKRVFKCHGCGARGDAFTFVQQVEGVDFRRALPILADLAGVPFSSKPWTPEERREYAKHHGDRELAEHFRMREAIPEHESYRAAAAYVAICASDPQYEAWLREDLEHAMAITALIVAMLARAPEMRGIA